MTTRRTGAGKTRARIRCAQRLLLALACTCAAAPAGASDHLDTRTVIDDPSADIGDLYAWTAADGSRLNLAMTIVGHEFSSSLRYEFHVDSGVRFGRTRATATLSCRFPSSGQVDCRIGDTDRATGDASGEAGLDSEQHGFRVFAGGRDDPFFNNVKGSRDAYQVASRALRDRAKVDAGKCPAFTAGTSQAILAQWRQTDGGPARNFLVGWTPASLVIAIDLDLVSAGGRMLAVWGTTGTDEHQVDRMGRPLTGNALLAPLAPDEVSDALKTRYNTAAPAQWPAFAADIRQTLGLYDGFDGTCGNQWLADPSAAGASRYDRLAQLLADDRLWVNADASTCTQFLAVELANLDGRREFRGDCGGRTPGYDAVDVYRSLLAGGRTTGVDDGVDRDELEVSDSRFPFLAAPRASAGDDSRNDHP